MMRHADKLALLVGSSPLPNYLAATVLKPREVVLLYSPETKEPRDYLLAALQELQITVKDVHIADATDARKIRDACQNLDIDHLHYSGGTKSMAVHARLSRHLSESQASYLDERKGFLRFDDGYDISLDQCDLGLTLDRILQLHGIGRLPTANGVADGPTDEDLTKVAIGMLCRPELAKFIREQLRPDDKPRSISKAREAPCIPREHGLELTVSAVPGQDWTNARYKVWDDFLTGGWLEAWTARLIRNCLSGSPADIAVNVRCKRAGPPLAEFEIDVALIRGHRLYVISCTTGRDKALCKSKLFEVAMRASQMGGDLARSALVCLLNGSDLRGPYVEQLRADIASVWDAPNVPKVFGLADLREWAGATGGPNLSSLQEWLES